jgi:cytochrome c5
MARLAPCPSCRRHVKIDESSCPFCHAAFPTALVPVEGDGARRIPRVAAIALAAGVTAATAGCTGGAQPLYGVAMDGGDVVDDAGGQQPLYGVALDAGDDDAGAGAPEYGLPADAGD